MGKITPGLKSILVIIAFLGFTNFILSGTRVNLFDLFEFNSTPSILHVETSAEVVDTDIQAVITSPVSENNNYNLTKGSSTFEPPGITLNNNILEICQGESQVELSFNTTNNPTHYSINFENSAFTPITNAALTSNPLILSIPNQLTAGSYNAQISVSNDSEVGEAVNFSINLKAIPTVNAVSDIVVCNGASVPAINFSGNISGTAYSWTNNTPSIGLASSGNGTISTFNAVNNGTTPVVA
ncbi:MAG: hypothetical protein ABJ092_05120, partial [Gillisia sp.]